MNRCRVVITVSIGLLLAGCSAPSPGPISGTSQPALPTPISTSAPGGPTSQPGVARLLRADTPRDSAPQVSLADQSALAEGNTAFAFDLYQAMRGSGGNLIASPYSISTALAMTYAGASGNTARQMAGTLHFTLPQETLHPAFNALGLALDSRNLTIQDPATQEQKVAIRLNIANALWGQTGYPFKQPFLDRLARNYDAGVQQVDFESAPEPARQAINQWASDNTNGKIKDVIPQGAITPSTRLVLANAVYLNALWLSPFEETATQDAPFHLLDGSQTQIKMMHQQETIGYAAGDDYQAVDLPYMGDQLSLLAILPADGHFNDFEGTLDAARFDAIRKALTPHLVVLGMPRFEMQSSVSLKQTLAALGMTDAFTDKADFSGMSEQPLMISDVLHKAYVRINESGTEAAAVTAVVVAASAIQSPPQQVTVTLDRPFIFVLYDQGSGAILFIGRVLNPAG